MGHGPAERRSLLVMRIVYQICIRCHNMYVAGPNQRTNLVGNPRPPKVMQLCRLAVITLISSRLCVCFFSYQSNVNHSDENSGKEWRRPRLMLYTHTRWSPGTNECWQTCLSVESILGFWSKSLVDSQGSTLSRNRYIFYKIVAGYSVKIIVRSAHQWHHYAVKFSIVCVYTVCGKKSIP